MSKGSIKLIAAGGMSKKARMALGMKQVPALGVWVLDRGVVSCQWRTPACDLCYNRKCLIYPDTKKAWSPGGKDDQFWAAATAANFRGLNRVRLCTRGDAFTCVDDCKRVGDWLGENPNCLFWVPTRSWQTGKRGSPENWYRINSPMVEGLQRYIQVHSNARLMASIDPWTIGMYSVLRDLNFSTMYFRKDNTAPEWYAENAHKCRKTWVKKINPKTGRKVSLKGVCRTCRGGCFSAERVDVWLGYHP